MLGKTARLAVVAVALGATVGSASHTARAAGGLGGYDLQARAPALELVLDSDALPVPAHPALDATIPETTSTLQSGPLGHGMASLLWPGDLGGHFGTALQQLGQLCTSMVPVAIPNLPTQCTPVPQALKDNASALNDPVKAETFLPGGPVDAEYTFTPPVPGVTMKSHAEGTTVDSLAGFASFGAPGVGTLGSVTSHSVAKVDNATAVSQATSELFDVALAGGLVTIDHVVSTAKETTDGQKAVGTGRTVISGVRIGGVPATVDGSGLQIGPLTAVANQALKSLGLEIQVTPPAILNDGAKGSFSAPLLVIRYRDDQNALEQAAVAMGQKLTTGSLQQVTGGLQQLALGPQAKVTLSMGGAVASVDASPALADTGVGGSSGGDVPGTPGTAGTSATPGSAGTTVSGLALAAPASSATPNRSSGPVAAVARALAGFGGLAWGLVLVAVVAAFGFGLGLYRYALALDAPSGAGVGRTCGTDPGH